MDDHERDDYLRIQRKVEKRRWMKESEIMRQITDEKTSYRSLPVDEMAEITYDVPSVSFFNTD